MIFVDALKKPADEYHKLSISEAQDKMKPLRVSERSMMRERIPEG